MFDPNSYKWLKRYTFNWYDQIPEGWKISFGEMMVKDIDKELTRLHLEDDLYIFEIKEKFGQLRIYHDGPESVDKIIDDYSALSSHICIRCGMPDVPYTNGWIMPLCPTCYKKLYPNGDYSKAIFRDNNNGPMVSSRKIIKNGQPIVYDLTELRDKIRAHWKEVTIDAHNSI